MNRGTTYVLFERRMIVKSKLKDFWNKVECILEPFGNDLGRSSLIYAWFYRCETYSKTIV